MPYEGFSDGPLCEDFYAGKPERREFAAAAERHLLLPYAASLQQATGTGPGTGAIRPVPRPLDRRSGQ
jgi:hypothetical protein